MVVLVKLVNEQPQLLNATIKVFEFSEIEASLLYDQADYIWEYISTNWIDWSAAQQRISTNLHCSWIWSQLKSNFISGIIWLSKRTTQLKLCSYCELYHHCELCSNIFRLLKCQRYVLVHEKVRPKGYRIIRFSEANFSHADSEIGRNTSATGTQMWSSYAFFESF